MARRAIDPNSNMYKVLQFLVEHRGPQLKRDICQALRMTSGQANTALNGLAQQIQVTNTGRGVWKWTGDETYLNRKFKDGKTTIAQRLLDQIIENPGLGLAEYSVALETSVSGAQLGATQLLESSLVFYQEVRSRYATKRIYYPTGYTGEICKQSKAPAKPPKSKGTIYSANERHWAHDCIGCSVPLALGESSINQL